MKKWDFKTHVMIEGMENKNNPTLSYAELVDMLKQSQATNQHLQEALQQSQLSNQSLQTTLNELRQQLDKLQRMLFGQRSERGRPQKDKTNDSDDQQKKSPSSNKKSSQKKSNGNGRRKPPPELPRQVMKHDLADDEKACQRCQGKLQCIGKDVSEQLEFIPAKLFVIEHRRYKYACRCCQSIITAPMPEQPIDKGLAGPGLLAETLIAKYQEHRPLYRQEKHYERLGYAIARSTLCDWVMACANQLAPIVDSMREDMLHSSPKIHSDDTIIPVLNQEKTHNGRLWVYIGGGGHVAPCVIFKYSKTRRGKEPKDFLSNYRGYLQADAYAGYDQCYASGDIIEVGCLAHARRKFVDALTVTEDNTLVQEAIDHIAGLYAIEKKAKSMSDKQRYYYRKQYAKPQLRAFYQWLIQQQALAPPKSPLGKAVYYCLNHFNALTNYLHDGVLAIDNNIAERAIRSVVIGRKNYLFAGSHQGAQHAATIYSLIETCKMLNINTFDYLTDVLRRIPTTLNLDIKSLIPYHWKPKKSNQCQ